VSPTIVTLFRNNTLIFLVRLVILTPLVASVYAQSPERAVCLSNCNETANTCYRQVSDAATACYGEAQNEYTSCTAEAEWEYNWCIWDESGTWCESAYNDEMTLCYNNYALAEDVICPLPYQQGNAACQANYDACVSSCPY
jgi:hypothetical protein